MSMRRVLYLPVETKSRELLGKLFLASKAVERGWIVVFGRQKEVFRAEEAGPAGACFENSIPGYKAERMKASRARGHRMVNLCEESIVYTDGWDYCSRRINEESLQQTDLLCVSGDWNAGHLRQHRPASETRIRLTGNPRFDTLMPEPRVVYQASADGIRRQHGRFLLVNTNFGSANPFERGRDILADIAGRGKVASDEHAAFLAKWRSYKALHMQRLQQFLDTVDRAGVFEKVIIRPHPVENHDVWREWATPLGMEVHYDGNANEWILAADAVLHTGCTTGLEGVLLDRPVASFVIDPASEFLNCTDEVSDLVASPEEFLERVRGWRDDSAEAARDRLAPQRAKLRSYLQNAEPPLAADRILDALDELDLPETTLDAARKHWGLRWKVGELIEDGKTRLRTLRDGKRRRSQKFPNLVMSEMQAPTQQWKSAGVLSRTLTFTKMADAVWLLS